MAAEALPEVAVAVAPADRSARLAPYPSVGPTVRVSPTG